MQFQMLLSLAICCFRYSVDFAIVFVSIVVCVLAVVFVAVSVCAFILVSALLFQLSFE